MTDAERLASIEKRFNEHHSICDYDAGWLLRMVQRFMVAEEQRYVRPTLRGW